MRLSKPRIAPLPESELTEEQRNIVAPMKQRYGIVFNVLKTLMRNMNLLNSWNGFAAHIMTNSTLDARLREMLIMRVGWLTQSDYEWGQHVLMSAPAGLTHADHLRIKEGPGAAGWNELEKTLLQAADELIADAFIQDATWNVLTRHLNTQQIMDAVFTVGQYNMLAMALNSMGVQREEGVPGFP
jgi:4-carboxymuconolactone decarboxylase